MASPLGSACRAVWQRFSSSDRYLHRNRDFEPIMAIAGPTVGRSGPPSPPCHRLSIPDATATGARPGHAVDVTWEASQVTSTAWPGRAPVAVASGMERRWQGGLGGPLLPTVGPAIAMIGSKSRFR